MSFMEFRSWIRVDGITIESDAAASLLAALDRHHGELGPVLSGAEGGVDVVLVTDVDEPVQAAERMYSAVASCLREIDQPSLFPSKVTIEPARELLPAS